MRKSFIGLFNYVGIKGKGNLSLKTEQKTTEYNNQMNTNENVKRELISLISQSEKDCSSI